MADDVMPGVLPVFTDCPGLGQVPLELLSEDGGGVQSGVARVD